jgi:hypothetical protein
MSAPALATITITPDDGENWTYQAWSFTAPPPPLAPSYGATGIPADPGWVNSAPPTAGVALTIAPGESLPGWYNVVAVGHQGIVFGHTATIDLHILNIPADPSWTKTIQAEVIYHVKEYQEGVHGYIDASSYVTAGNDTYQSTSVIDIALLDGWRDVTIEWCIPQIYAAEVIHLYLMDTGVAVDSVGVATVCIPEPATLLLLGGAGLVGWLRRRKKL